MADIRVEDHGSLYLFRALSPGGLEWLGQHTDGMWIGNALAVEPRYAEALAAVARDAGLEVE